MRNRVKPAALGRDDDRIAACRIWVSLDFAVGWRGSSGDGRPAIEFG